MTSNHRPITNLKERRRVWDQRYRRAPRDEHDLTDSLPYPFEVLSPGLFDGKDVLEIGPGNGRQYERIRQRAGTYAIADISAAALAEPVFASVDAAYLLSSWDQQLGCLFDTVHFWYVLHHIRQDEMPDFFSFVHRHLRPGGLCAFNTPEPMNVQGDPGGDGCGTTYSDPDIVQRTCQPLEMLTALPIRQKSTGHVFLLRKIRQKSTSHVLLLRE